MTNAERLARLDTTEQEAYLRNNSKYVMCENSMQAMWNFYRWLSEEARQMN